MIVSKPDGLGEIHIGDFSSIRINVGDTMFDICERDSKLEVYKIGTMSDTILVQPCASNVIIVK